MNPVHPKNPENQGSDIYTSLYTKKGILKWKDQKSEAE